MHSAARATQDRIVAIPKSVDDQGPCRIAAIAVAVAVVFLLLLAMPRTGHAVGHDVAACATASGTRSDVRVQEAELAGVPALLRVPAHASRPPIVLWHGFGAPASERALMAQLPLDDVPAVKVYLGLPLFGARSPADKGDGMCRLMGTD